MAYDEHPLDRISSGPAPTGPNPWRSNRLPTGSPYANGLYGTGDVRNPRRLGRVGWITLIVAVALIAGAVGWAAVSKPDPAGVLSPGTVGNVAPPRPPSVDQITASGLFTLPLATPPACALPPLGTDRDAVQRFSDTATRCLETVWGLRAGTVRVFSSSDDVPPDTSCFNRGPVETFGNCNDVLYVNLARAVEASGNQRGPLLQWLSLAVADRAEARAGVSADIDALTRSVGESGSTGIEYRKRAHVQGLCLAGATLSHLVDHGITRVDVAVASTQSRIWTLLGDGPNGPKIEHSTAQNWFDRGSLSPTQEVCRTAWTVPVDQVS